MQYPQDSIAAIATAQGRGGVGIVRVSGPLAAKLCREICQLEPQARQARFGNFYAENNHILDQGISLFFQAPNSFTGEDVLELQGHGGPVVMDMLLERCLQLGARPARPGEFSERAFLNDKMDLAQAEAIADLIAASSKQAAANAMRSLQGDFSKQVNHLTEQLIKLRIYVEAAIDFPEEEIDFLADGQILADLKQVQQQLAQVQQQANQGALLREGMNVVIAGRPNAGKSSLLNALAGYEAAIVTDIAGTTRDILKEHVHIDGMPLHITDTAGLRETSDQVEKIGVNRALEAINNADRILLMVDANTQQDDDIDKLWAEFMQEIPALNKITLIHNKIDLLQKQPSISQLADGHVRIDLSAATGAGLDLLRQHLKQIMGYQQTSENTFSARRRHLQALAQAASHLQQGEQQLLHYNAGELLADELRMAQQSLAEITGEFTADDLLGRIFSSFCIGK